MKITRLLHARTRFSRSLCVAQWPVFTYIYIVWECDLLYWYRNWLKCLLGYGSYNTFMNVSTGKQHTYRELNSVHKYKLHKKTFLWMKPAVRRDCIVRRGRHKHVRAVDYCDYLSAVYLVPQPPPSLWSHRHHATNEHLCFVTVRMAHKRMWFFASMRVRVITLVLCIYKKQWSRYDYVILHWREYRSFYTKLICTNSVPVVYTVYPVFDETGQI